MKKTAKKETANKNATEDTIKPAAAPAAKPAARRPPRTGKSTEQEIYTLALDSIRRVLAEDSPSVSDLIKIAAHFKAPDPAAAAVPALLPQSWRVMSAPPDGDDSPAR